jgi:hypothetical protein
MKSLVLLFSFIAIQCSACTNVGLRNEPASSLNDNSFIKAPEQSKFSRNYRSPQRFFQKGRFSIVLYGVQNEQQISELDEGLSKKINIETTDYQFVDLSNASETELNQIKVDFPLLEGLYAVSPSGGLITKCSTPTLSTIDSVLSRIHEIELLYGLNGIALSDFKSFAQPAIEKTDRKNIFHVGTFNNVIFPDEFCEQGRISILIFSTPGCLPCEKLKKDLLNATDEVLNSADFYFVNHAFDDNGNQYSWSQIKTTKAIKVYAIEGMKSFPTVWLLSPTGSFISVVDAGKTGDLSLYEYIKTVIDRYTGIIIADNNPQNDNPDLPRDNSPAPGTNGNNENSNAGNYYVSIKGIQIHNETLSLGYESGQSKTDCSVSISIESSKGQPIIKTTKVCLLNETSGNTNFSLKNSGSNLEKRTKYKLTLIITSGNKEIFRIAKLEFKTDKNNFADIVL